MHSLDRAHERGVALVLVLGLVALLSAWAVQAAVEDELSLRRAENMKLSTSAWMGTKSGIELAKHVLIEDKGDVDSLDETWAAKSEAYPIDDGMVYISIKDANRFYNLNDLVDDKGIVRSQEVSIAKRLFRAVEVPEALVDAVIDWMDADASVHGADGAEDSAYFEYDYRVKNAPFDRLNELLLVKGMTREYWLILKKVITISPSGDKPLKINLNSAEKELLIALFPKATDSDIELIISSREGAPYIKIEEAIGIPGEYEWAKGAERSRLSVSSDCFIIRSESEFGRARWGEEVMVKRTAKGISTLYRQKLGWDQLRLFDKREKET